MAGTSDRTLLAICTRNRPDQLRRLLTTLLSAIETTSIPVRLFVADNGDSDEARTLVSELTSAGASIGYVAVAERGVSRVRNAAFDERRPGEHLLFIDDDEWPAPDFFDAVARGLERFPGCLLGFEQTGVIGDEHFPTFGPDVQDGDVIEACGFGNILIPSDLLDQFPLRCDLRYARSGGEDTDFCFAARKRGYVTVALPSAVCFETRDHVRRTLRYRWKRSFAEGAIYSDILRRHQRSRLVTRVPRLLVRTVIGLGLAVLDGVRGQGFGRGIESCALGVGGFAGLVGVLPARY